MNNICESIDKYNPKKRRYRSYTLIVFDDMIANMLSNKKPQPIVTQFFIRRKINSSLVFITESYYAAPKNIRLNSVRCFITKFPNKRELQKIETSYSFDIEFEGILKLVQRIHSQTLVFLCKQYKCAIR